MDPFTRIALAALPYTPTPILRKVASRYVSGETLDSALSRLAELARDGYRGILDLLGEEVRSEDTARGVARAYQEASSALASAGLDAYVSVKPTHVGLLISEQLAFENYSTLAAHCRDLGLFCRVEMEDHSTTDATLRVFERLRVEYDNVGIVLQSRLRRTPDDIAALAPGPLDVRMVKGVYLEPPEIAFVDPEPIREAFLRCTRALFERGASVGFATHDEGLADRLLELVSELEIPAERYEFQVLMGVREPLWRLWRDAGHRVRVYVPYGPDWRAYSLRRLRKNPQIFRHVVRDVLTPRRT